MTDRLEEAHAAPIDLPLALFGVGLGADVLGRIVGSDKLQAIARYLMPAAATAAAFTVASDFLGTQLSSTGAAANESRQRRLSTLPMASAAAALATWRWRQRTASAPYLALGLAAIGAIARSGDGAHRFQRDAGSAAGERPAIPREPPTAQVAAAVRTEAADRLRGL